MSNANDFVIENGVLVKYTGKGGAVAIPEGITQIGAKAFQRKGKVVSVEVPEGVEEIGELAFAGCNKLEWVKLPQSTKTIGNGAFRDCPELRSVTAPDSVTVGSHVCYNSSRMADEDGFAIIGGTLCEYFGSGGAVVIPERVTCIAQQAFASSLVTSVVIPMGVTELASDTFAWCKELTEVILPESLTKIGFAAFGYCEKLGSIVVPKSVVSINGSAFRYCKALKQVVLSEGLETIEQSAFVFCEELTEITIPSTVTSIGPEAFVYCNNLKRITILSDQCKISPKILDSSYLMWYKFVPMWYRDISALPPGFRPNAAVAFAEDGGDPADVRYEGHMKYIKSNAIKLLNLAMEYPSLLALMCRQKLIAAKHVESFLEAAQKTENPELVATVLDYQANKLTGKQKERAEQQKEKQDNTVLDRAVARVNQVGISGLNFVVTGDVYTFANRKELKNYIESQGATLQTSMSAKTDYLIMNNSSIDSEKKRRAAELGIEVLTEAQFNEKAGRQFEVDENGKLTRYVGPGGDVTIPDVVRAIGSNVFMCNDRLTAVTVPDSVIAIEEYAFSGCTKLAAVNLGSGVASVGDFAFADCQSLCTMCLPDCVTAIGKGVFQHCHNLSNVVIPDSVEKIGGRAFYGCDKLANKQGFFIHQGILHSYSGADGNVVIPDDVTGISDEAFYCCSNLTAVTIGSNVRTIGKGAFDGCGRLKKVTIPDSVTAIGEYAFNDCDGLKSVTIPDSVTSLGEHVFSGCSNLTTVTIGNGVTTIGDEAFYYCTGLTSVTLGNSVTAIGEEAFSSCYRLTSINIPEGVTFIGEMAFEGCDRLKINGYAGSYAEAYAAENDIPFVTQCEGEKKVSKTNDFIVRYGLLERYRGSEENVVIPASVTQIGFDAFHNCKTITSVTIPDSVITIPAEAFRGCDKLISVRLGSGIRNVWGAFNRCPSLVKITMPACVGAVVSKNLVYSDRFRIDIPDLNVLTPAFRLSAVLCFAEDGGMAEDIRFETYSKYIQANSGKMIKAAVGNTALLALLCRERWIKAKDVAAYLNAAQQTGNVQIIAIVQDYLNNTLTDKEKEKMKKQQALQVAASDRAAERRNRESIAGLNFVLSGELCTFENRKELKDFIEQQGAKLQNSMSAKTDYLIMNQYKADPGKKQTAEELGIEIITEFQFNDKAHRQFETSENGTLTRYRGAGGDVIIPQSVCSIGREAFMHCFRLDSVTLGASVTAIGKMGFYDCVNLNAVSIAEGVITIDDFAFLGCNKLTSVTIPDSVTAIGEGAFGRCTALTEVHLGSGITAIANSAFKECNCMTSVTIPDSVTAIGEGAFGRCAALTEVKMGSGITTIGNSAFRECKDLPFVEIPDSVATIDKMAFRSCDSLSEVRIGTGVAVISGAAFLDCKSLASVNIPGNVVIIGDSSFGRCGKLSSVTIGNGTTTIEASAFRACGNLATVTIPATVTSIGEFAFRDCPNLTIHAPAGSYAETYAKENNIPFVAE